MANSGLATLLAKKKGSFPQFILATIPLLGVFVYFLVQASRESSLAIYNLSENYTDDEWQRAAEQSESFISLMDILTAFLVFHCIWTIVAVYVIIFIPKRRHLIGRYLKEGEQCLGDVIYDQRSRFCSRMREYGFAVYAHPTQKQNVVRKRVRVYQNYTRERVTILRLPNRPLSGQCKIDLEIDLSAANRERDFALKHIVRWTVFWVIFTLAGSMFVLYELRSIHALRNEFSFYFKLFLIVAGFNVPFAFAINWMRFTAYYNWMINRGALIEDQEDARKVDYICTSIRSEDGSDEVIPYSIINEDELSYTGTLPSHSGSVAGTYAAPHTGIDAGDHQSKAWVSV